MAGTKGKSGGKREGAGRPVETRTLRTGQQLLYHEHDASDNPTAMPCMATVEVVSRTKIILHLDNSKIILGY
jgi:hypothetical protein